MARREYAEQQCQMERSLIIRSYPSRLRSATEIPPAGKGSHGVGTIRLGYKLRVSDEYQTLFVEKSRSFFFEAATGSSSAGKVVLRRQVLR